MTGAMIGAGYFAQFQAEAWNRIPDARIEAIVDLDLGRAREFAHRWGFPRAYADVETMLREVKPEFVDIVTRPDTHWELTEAAARNGVHVICQKPMAPTWEECAAMVEACDRAGVRLLLHENWRFQPWFREMKRIVASGMLGTVYHLSYVSRTGDGRGPGPYPVQPYFREMERFLLYETVVHFLDTFRYLNGEVERITCRTERINPVIRGEDYALLQLDFRNGSHGIIQADRISGPITPPLTMGEVRILGERAALRLAEDGCLWLTHYGEEERLHGYEWSEDGYRGGSVKATQEHLLECLRTGEAAETEGREYLKTVALVFAGYRSAETGETVALKNGNLFSGPEV